MVELIGKSGKKVYLLNPSERGRKYAIEMRSKRALTNDGKRKYYSRTGQKMYLTKEQMAFRAGYLQHQKDSSKVFKSKHPRYKRKSK